MVMNESSVGDRMVSPVMGSLEDIVGREGAASPLDSWFERPASVILTLSTSSTRMGWIERLPLDMGGASSDALPSPSEECVRCGEGILEGAAEPRREKDLISLFMAVTCAGCL